MEAQLPARPFGSRHSTRWKGSASPTYVLGLCGLLSAIPSAAGGFLELPLFLLGVAGATMVGNVYAIVGGRRARRGGRTPPTGVDLIIRGLPLNNYRALQMHANEAGWSVADCACDLRACEVPSMEGHPRLILRVGLRHLVSTREAIR